MSDFIAAEDRTVLHARGLTSFDALLALQLEGWSGQPAARRHKAARG